MRVLYIANHAVLEYDELRLFEFLGYEVFSTGFYKDPASPEADIRPPLPNLKVHRKAAEMWERFNFDPKRCLENYEFPYLFDAIVCVHNDALLPVLATITQVPIYIRMIGQSMSHHESRLNRWRNKYKIIRYSPNEQYWKNFAGQDALIRFGKIVDDFHEWSPVNQHVLSFYQSSDRRPARACLPFYLKAVENVNPILFGGGNNSVPWRRQPLSYDDMLLEYSRTPIYFSLGTMPASYTLNLMEAMLTGCPIVAPGRLPLSNTDTDEPERCALAYEVPELLHGLGYEATPNTPEMAEASIRQLLQDEDLRASASNEIKKRAQHLFSAELIAPQWKSTLEGY